MTTYLFAVWPAPDRGETMWDVLVKGVLLGLMMAALLGVRKLWRRFKNRKP